MDPNRRAHQLIAIQATLVARTKKDEDEAAALTLYFEDGIMTPVERLRILDLARLRQRIRITSSYA